MKVGANDVQSGQMCVLLCLNSYMYWHPDLQKLLSNHTPPPLSILLSKTSYDMSIHLAESSDWVNVLLAQILQGYRNDLLSEGGEEGARQRVEGWLNPKGENLSWLDPIDVTSLSLGTSYPLLSNARIRPADGQGRLVRLFIFLFSIEIITHEYC